MDIFQYANKNPKEILQEFGISSNQGLFETEAQNRLEKYGPNKASGQEIRPWQIFIRQFQSPFIYLLVAAAVIAFFLAEPIDSGMILLFVAINSFLGFYQEYRSEEALKLLQNYVVSYTKVIRQGKQQPINGSMLVPGDLIVLETGDSIPADCRIIESTNLEVDESILSGESITIHKTAETLSELIDDIYQAKNLVFTSTFVISGKAKAIVLATGPEASLGRIAKLTIETVKESNFTKQIAQFGKFILRLIGLILVFVFLANLIIKGKEANIANLVVFSIALAVSVIPEALPLVITLSLSRGALRLAKKKVVVRRLSAIEDLGGIEILCTDKTGTLTENNLTVTDLGPDSLAETIFYANLASSSIERKKLEPFDIALWVSLDDKEKKQITDFKRLEEIPFDPKRRRNSVLVQSSDHQQLIVRGAPEVVLALCDNLDSFKNKRLNQWLIHKGLSGERVLAVARKTVDKLVNEDISQFENNMSLIGLIAFEDQIKLTIVGAVEEAEKLGVKIKIITGDSKEVALAVAKKIGLIKSSDEATTGEEFIKLSHDEQQQKVQELSVFARVLPEEKFEIIKILQEGHQVGYLGEGINDAPALKVAGVSLVVDHAADIARDAADVVLLEKDLQVIIDGIRQGREIFANTIKYIKATMTSNFGNFYAVAVASLLVTFLPMLPLQILLLNLLSDFPMIAIAADNVDQREISQPQKFNLKDIILVTTLLGVVSTIFDFMFFGLFYKISAQVLQTNWFIGSILTELILLFSIRTKLPFYKANRPAGILIWLTITAMALTIILPYSHFGQTVFKFVAPKAIHIGWIVGLGLAYFATTEVVKLSYYKLLNKNR